MDDAADRLTGVIFGWWSSRILEAGTRLGVFDAMPKDGTIGSDELAVALECDRARMYRLLRALAGIGTLAERDGRRFELAPMGALLRDEPNSMRAMALHEISPFAFRVWSELEDVVRDADRNGVERAFDKDLWQYLSGDAEVNGMFNLAMTSYSAHEAAAVTNELRPRELPREALVCDVGGGHGALLASLLRARPDLRGIVVDLPATAAEGAADPAHADLGDRLRFVEGDAFAAVPEADVYLFKHMLHDFDDDECERMLRIARDAARENARAFIAEFVVPGVSEPHFGKLFDIHMLLMNRGRERTADEYAALLERAGWRGDGVRSEPGSPLAVVAATAAGRGHAQRGGTL